MNIPDSSSLIGNFSITNRNLKYVGNSKKCVNIGIFLLNDATANSGLKKDENTVKCLAFKKISNFPNDETRTLKSYVLVLNKLTIF